MKRIWGLSCRTPQIISCVSAYLPQRGLRTIEKAQWVRPRKVPLNHPGRSGDLEGMPDISEDSLRVDYQDLEELQTASKEVKDIFSLKYQLPKQRLAYYKNQLLEKVKCHEYDDSSYEAKIAIYTAKIRFLQKALEIEPHNSFNKRYLNDVMGKRFKNLKLLRKIDYKKFEHILEKLNIVYRPITDDEMLKVTRKKSIRLIINLEAEKVKEQKLGALKKMFDEKKVPFLEKKLEKLKWIQQAEKENNLTPSVTDRDLENLRRKIEKVKVEVSERQKRGYVRDIHPYFLEPYDEKLLQEKEEALRERKRLENEKSSEKNVE